MPGDPVPPNLVVAGTFFSGPLPPPETLRLYEEVVPGAAKRILKMAEVQAEHRHSLENRVVNSNVIKSYLGITAAFVIALVAVSGGCFVAYSGQPWAGVAIGGTSVTALVVAFLKGTSDRRHHWEAKLANINARRNNPVK